jgi:hypothetical protein
MTSQAENVIRVECSRELWPLLGWGWGACICELQPYFELTEDGRLLVTERIPAMTSTVDTPWDYERSIMEAELVRTVKPRRGRRRRRASVQKDNVYDDDTFHVRDGTLKLLLADRDFE